MRVMMFGGSGFVGSHVASELQAAGHQVSALARNAASAEKLGAAGIGVVPGDLEDELDWPGLFADFDAVIYAAQLLLEPENAAVGAMLSALEGTGKTFIFTSGTGVVAQRTDGFWSEDSFAEDDPFVPYKPLARRTETEAMVRAAAIRGVRSLVIRPPSIWGNGGSHMLQYFFDSIERTGAVCYLGPGLNLYSNVHVEDLARLFRLALEKGEAGALYHAVAGEVNYHTVAHAIARHRGVAARDVAFEEAERIWGRFGAIIAFSVCSRSRSPRARRELGWRPQHLDMLADITHPAYLTGSRPFR
jgi:nucleoside-diphosphate-sugar epimerase